MKADMVNTQLSIYCSRSIVVSRLKCSCSFSQYLTEHNKQQLRSKMFKTVVPKKMEWQRDRANKVFDK